jgi:hypothetical protein
MRYMYLMSCEDEVHVVHELWGWGTCSLWVVKVRYMYFVSCEDEVHAFRAHLHNSRTTCTSSSQLTKYMNLILTTHEIHLPHHNSRTTCTSSSQLTNYVNLIPTTHEMHVPGWGTRSMWVVRMRYMYLMSCEDEVHVVHELWGWGTCSLWVVKMRYTYFVSCEDEVKLCKKMTV